MTLRLELGNKCASRVDAAISDNPNLAIQAKGLVFAFGFRIDFEQRMAEAHVATEPYILSVWTAELLKIYQPLQQLSIDRGTIKVNNSGEAAHRGSELCRGNAASKAA